MTTALLDQRGVFAETVDLATRTGASPYREALAIAFEAEMIRHDHE